MDKIKAIIVEDEKKSRETLRGLLERYCAEVEIVAEAEGYRSGLRAIETSTPDVVFLDIQMPDGSGFKLLENLEQIDFEIIFTTAYDQFAIKAIKYSALDYLLKPIVPEELISAIKKLRKFKLESRQETKVDALLDNLHGRSGFPHKIVLSTAEKIHVVEVDQIIRCESDNYYTRFFFSNGEKLLISRTLKENEELLSEHNFIRPHKSHLINMRYIKSFKRNDGGCIIMTDGAEVPVSRRKKEKIIDIINHL